MESQTELGRMVSLTGSHPEFDAECKLVLSYKAVLARILMECVEEYKGYGPEEIESFIEYDPVVGSAGVGRNVANAVAGGGNTEDSTVNEGVVRYDILFSSVVPGTDERIGLIINVEAQSNPYPGYRLHSRAAYYCARLLSAQFGSDLKGADYGRLRRVYSIWLCRNMPKRMQNSINEYRMVELPRTGASFGNDAGSDLMRIVMICLGDPDEASSILRMLDILLARKMGYERKKDLLTAEYGLPFTEQFDRRFIDMCNFSSGIFEEGRAEGREEGRIEGHAEGRAEGREEGSVSATVSAIRNVMESFHVTLEAAMEALKVPVELRPAVMKALG